MTESVYTPIGNLGVYGSFNLICFAGSPLIYLNNGTITLSSSNNNDLISIYNIGPAVSNYVLNTQISTVVSVTEGVIYFNFSSGGSYTGTPTVNITGGGGSGAAATAVMSGGAVVGVIFSSYGSGYTSNPTISFTGGGGSGAAATPVVFTGYVVDVVNSPSISLTVTGNNNRIGVVVGTDQASNMQSWLTTQQNSHVTPVLDAGMYMLSTGIISIPAPYQVSSNSGSGVLKCLPGCCLRGCNNTNQTTANTTTGAVLTLGSGGVWDSTVNEYQYYEQCINAMFLLPGTIDGGSCFQYCLQLPYVTNSTVEDFTTSGALQKGVWMGVYGTGTNPSGGGTPNPPSSAGNLFHNFKHFGNPSVQYLDTTYGTNGISTSGGVVKVKTLGTNVIPVGSIISTGGTGWGAATGLNQSLDGTFAYVSANSSGVLTLSNLNGANYQHINSTGTGYINPYQPPASWVQSTAPYLAVSLPNMDIPIQITNITVSGGVATVTFGSPITYMANSNVPFEITDVMGMGGFIDGFYVIYVNSTGTGGELYVADIAVQPNGSTVMSGGYSGAAGNSYYPSGGLNGASTSPISVPTSTPSYVSGGWAIKWTDPSVVPGAIWLNNCDDINIAHGTIRDVRVGVGSIFGGWDSKFCDIHLWNQGGGFMLTPFYMGGKNSFTDIQIDTPVKFCFRVKQYGNTMTGCSYNQNVDNLLGGLPKCTTFVRLDGNPISTGWSTNVGAYNATATVMGGAVYATSDLMLSDVSVAGMEVGLAPGFKRIGFDTSQGNILYEQPDGSKPSVGMRNKIRNGGMQTWARGSSINVPANTWTVTADGWYVYSNGVSLTASGSSPIGSAASSLSLSTSASSSQTYIYLAQPLDADAASPLANKILTFQAKVQNNTNITITPQLLVYIPNTINGFGSYQNLEVYPYLQPCPPGVTTTVSAVFIGDPNMWKGALTKLVFNNGGAINSYTITNAGSGYSDNQYVYYLNGSGAQVTIGDAYITNGSITSINITNPVGGLASPPTIYIGNYGGGSGATATVTVTPLWNASNITVSDVDLSQTPGELPWQIVPGFVWVNSNAYQYSNNPPVPEIRLKSVEDDINRRWYVQKTYSTAGVVTFNPYMVANTYHSEYIHLNPPMYGTPSCNFINSWTTSNVSTGPIITGLTSDTAEIYFESGSTTGVASISSPANGGYYLTCEFSI